MLDLATRTVHEPAGLDGLSDEFTGETLDVVLISPGSEWLEGRVDGAHRENSYFFLAWRTGQRRDHPLGRGEAANLDSPTLVQHICSPLRRGTQAYPVGEGDTFLGFATAWYARPYFVTYDGRSELPNLYLERCGSARADQARPQPRRRPTSAAWRRLPHLDVLPRRRPDAGVRLLPSGRKTPSLGPGTPLHAADWIFVSTGHGFGPWTVRAASLGLKARPYPDARGLAPVSPMPF